MKNKFLLSICCAALCTTISLSAKISLPVLIADNMVLQQQTTVTLWGQTDQIRKGTTVTVTTSWDGHTYKTQAESGKWKIRVTTPKAGGPYSLNFSDGSTPVAVNNVLIGEVWLCSGQSNMEMPMKGFSGQPIAGSLEVITAAKPADPIRMITIQRAQSKTPTDECVGNWEVSSPQSVSNVSATAYFYAKYLQEHLQVPVGIICSTWGGTPVETWINRETFEKQFPEISLTELNKDLKDIANAKNQPTLLYNAMIYPLRNYTIKGAIWYQGEANRGNPEQYKALFPAMVQHWRELWGSGNFPFYYIQIAPYDYGRTRAEEIESARLRQVQTDCMALIPNSGMAVTSNIGERTCIHPAAKYEVGQRLALWALTQTYGMKGFEHSGPLVNSAVFKEKNLVLSFNYAESGIHHIERDTPIEGFEVAGTDSIFHPATGTIFSNATKISLTCDKVAKPAIVRYCFKNYQPTTLYANNGLPVAPFEVIVQYP